MSAPFTFKQFSIQQNHAPMKVGTDGVLLGAWCSCDHAQTALDIGTGTGIIALMLAQRNNIMKITAIEPNDLAVADAELNFKKSKWNERIECIKTDFHSFVSPSKFDLIVSNPPFFKNALRAPDENRNAARHIENFGPEEFAHAASLLTKTGILSGIYPLPIFEQFHRAACAVGLFPLRLCEVFSTPFKPSHRMLFEYTFAERPNPKNEKIIIEENGRHGYSEIYKKLTRDFYLNF